MTIQQALAELAILWPDVSFSISVDVWSHFHNGRDHGRKSPIVEWSIYHADDRGAFRHPTLEGALAIARTSATTPGRGLALVQRADDAVAEGL